jgi:hypothetical protein
MKTVSTTSSSSSPPPPTTPPKIIKPTLDEQLIQSALLLDKPTKKTIDPTSIHVIDIDLPNRRDRENGKYAKYAFNVFTPTECEALIASAETKGFEVALVNVGGNMQIKDTDYRKSGRCIIDSHLFAQELLNRIQHILPSTFMERKITRINERMRFLRYDQGDYFKPHYDGSYTTPDGKHRTLITVQIYLNEGFIGGETTFLDTDAGKDCRVIPTTGGILLFEHHLLHEGSTLLDAKKRKYTIRCDVLYETALTRTGTSLGGKVSSLSMSEEEEEAGEEEQYEDARTTSEQEKNDG